MNVPRVRKLPAMRSGPAAVCLVAVSVGCGGVLVGDGTYTMHRTDGKTAHCVPSLVKKTELTI